MSGKRSLEEIEQDQRERIAREEASAATEYDIYGKEYEKAKLEIIRQVSRDPDYRRVHQLAKEVFLDSNSQLWQLLQKYYGKKKGDFLITPYFPSEETVYCYTFVGDIIVLPGSVQGVENIDNAMALYTEYLSSKKLGTVVESDKINAIAKQLVAKTRAEIIINLRPGSETQGHGRNSSTVTTDVYDFFLQINKYGFSITKKTGVPSSANFRNLTEFLEYEVEHQLRKKRR